MKQKGVNGTYAAAPAAATLKYFECVTYSYDRGHFGPGGPGDRRGRAPLRKGDAAGGGAGPTSDRDVGGVAVSLQQLGELLGENEVVFGKPQAGEVLVDVAEHQLDLGNEIL